MKAIGDAMSQARGRNRFAGAKAQLAAPRRFEWMPALRAGMVL
jgi:hypothetical protein